MNIPSNFGLYKTAAAKPAGQSAFGVRTGRAKGLAIGKSSSKVNGYMKQAKAAMARLQEAIGCVNAAKDTVFMGPQSTDTFAVSLNYSGSRFDRFDDIAMSVEQAATANQTMGFAQDAAGSDYAAGTHTFAVDIEGGKSVELTIEVGRGESNASVQRKMAAAVNGAGLGIEASAGSHRDGGKTLSFLSLTSKGLGDDAVSFTVRDVGDSSLVHQSGIGRMSQQAQNARYTVNGKAYESTSNVVEVGNGVTATIRGASRGEFAITDGFYETNAKNMLSILYTPLNDIKTIAAEMKKETGEDFLLLKIEAMYNQTAAALGQFGVMIGTDGLFNVSETGVGKALGDGSLRSFLQDYYQNGGGFIAQLQAFATGTLQGGTIDQSV